MKKSKHTPGPWEAGDGVILCADPDMAIGSVFPCDRDKSPHGSGFAYGEVTKANARLIAAAPELLEACKALDHWLYEVGSARANGESVYSYTELQSMRDNAAELARAAIAKATGEQS